MTPPNTSYIASYYYLLKGTRTNTVTPHNEQQTQRMHALRLYRQGPASALRSCENVANVDHPEAALWIGLLSFPPPGVAEDDETCTQETHICVEGARLGARPRIHRSRVQVCMRHEMTNRNPQSKEGSA